MPENVIEAPITSLKTASGSVVPPSSGEINVIAQPITSAPPPKPGSVKGGMFERLRGKATQDGRPPAPAEAPKPAPVAEPPAKPAFGIPNAEPEPEVDSEGFALGEDVDEPKSDATKEKLDADPKAPAAEKPGEPKAKVSPWKLVDEYKERLRRAEVESLELKKMVPNEEARRQEMAEVEAIRKRSQELESEIRNVNFAKSEEFKTKFEQPYQQEWEQTMAEISEISVIDPETGEERRATSGDIMEVVNLPLGQARKVAEEKFGSFADDIMARRKSIREKHQVMNSALEEARKAGETVLNGRMQQMQQMRETINTEVKSHWQEFNGAIAKDKRFGKFFTPAEGDVDGNTKLEKGFKLVDSALAMNPLDPRLSPEQRKEAVRMHTAVRNRAAAFGRLASTLSAKEARIAQLEAELKQYKGSEPETTGRTAQQPAGPTSVRSSMLERLHRLAK